MIRKLANLLVGVLTLAGTSLAQGPVVLLGIDAEDGGVGSHGPLSAYTSAVANGLIANVTNGGTGMLVIGGGKSTGDNVTTWFNALGASLSIPVTHVNGAAGISSQSFAGFALVAVASSAFETSSGGLQNIENVALTARAADLALHVNGGGGLFGLAQEGLSTPYGYLGAIGSFSFGFPASFSDITATPAGLLVGLNNTVLDVCCWHDEYLSFPGFLDVLAVNSTTGNPCAVGGANVIIVQDIALTPLTATVELGQTHTVVASVADTLGNPIPGANVQFEVTGGPNSGKSGTGVTNVAGKTEFTYTGNQGLGTDMLSASFVDAQGDLKLSNSVEVNWIEPAECFLLLGLSPLDIVFANGDHLLTMPLASYVVSLDSVPSFQIPSDPALIGLSIYFQVYMNNPLVFPDDPFKMSNGLQVRIGDTFSSYGVATGMQLWASQPLPLLGSTLQLKFSIDGF